MSKRPRNSRGKQQHAHTQHRSAKPPTLSRGEIGKPQQPPPPRDSSRVATTDSEAGEHGSSNHAEILKDALRGVLFALILVLIRMPLEHNEYFEQFRLLAYNATQHKLAANAGPGVAVTVVDISQLPGAAPVGTGDGAFTPRKPLEQLIKSIALAHPSSIGVDIDFSPDEHGFIVPDDPEFFRFCQDIARTTGVPVFLGVERSAALGKEYWLGSPDFADLAASLVVPQGRTRMLYNWTRVGVNGEPCITMAAALARAANRLPGHAHSERRPPWARWAVEERIPQHLPQGVEAEGFVVDYGHLDSLTQDRIPGASLLSADNGEVAKARSALLHHAVLIGDATAGLTADQFVVADRPEPVPGTLLHACAADTLIQSPLYDFTLAGRLAVDMLVAIGIVFTVAGLRWRSTDLKADEEKHHLRHGVVTWVVVLAAFLLGIEFVSRTRVLWDDLPLVMAGLFAHRPLENAVASVVHRFRKEPDHIGTAGEEHKSS